ncbi:MAG: hypothetical protein HY936_08050 [Nitrosomonadales bacterium]|nr:hypothetical protein [Nitrosomonadales bacterium]
MLNSLPVRLIWYSFNWLTRLSIIASAAMAVLAAMAIILLRYWFLPNIEQHHDRIAISLASAIGNPVTIGKIEGDWQGFRPRLNFNDVRILDGQRQAALVLPSINASVSWMSLFTAELRLASLEIDRPELLVRRDVHGRVYIGGVALSNKSNDKDLADWLLHQSHMVVHQALIVWIDEQRAAPPLVLGNVDLRIESLFDHHQFAMHAKPPGELATSLDVRGDFYGKSFDALSEWRGQMFAQLDHTDITAWRPWLDLPKEFSRGSGALRGWLGLENGRIVQVTADLVLRNVVTQLADNAPEMVLHNLRGRFVWKDLAGGVEISTRQLAMRLQGGIELRPTDFYYRTSTENNTQPASSEIRANQLQLESLAGLANFLPLDADLRTQLHAYAPRGRVSNLNAQWQGHLEKPGSYKIKGEFENLAVRKVGEMPGFSGLSVDVDGSGAKGKLNIKSHQLSVDAPGVMREPLLFATLTGQAGWQIKGGELLVSADNIAFANDDLEGNFHGSYQSQAGTPGVLDLTVGLTRADVRHAARYTPLVALDKEGNDWLHDALLAGHTKDLRIRIKGNLSDFPLDGTTRCAQASGAGVPPPRLLPQTAGCASVSEAGGAKDALLEISGHAQNVVVAFNKNWPPIENISGELLIRGNKLEVKSPSATTLGARLKNFTVTLPDMMSDDLPLEIKGEAAGPSNAFLQYIQQSPVRGYIGGFTDGMSASGNGNLDLFVHVPLLGSKPVKVSGALRIQDSDIDFGEGVPLLRKTRGELAFTESSMKADNVLAEILGGAASVDVQTAGGGTVHATVKGRNNLDVLRKDEPHPLLDYLHGSAAWDADISVAKKSTQVVINSNMQGISSSLPQPFAKTADEVMPLRIGKRNAANGQDVITAQLGKLLSARLVRSEENGAMAVKRGTLRFGDQGKSPDTQSVQESWRGKDGVRLVGSLPVLSIQGWKGLVTGTEDSGVALPITAINLDIEKLTGYGLAINGVHIDAGKRGDGLSAQLSGDALNGEVVWQPRALDTGGKIIARLRNFEWMGDQQPLSATPDRSPLTGNALRPGNLPALEISIENLQLKGKQIGNFELEGRPDGKDWKLNRLHIINPEASLFGDGVWRGANAQTQINLQLEIRDAGKILARSGYPNTVKGGSGKLGGDLSWAGHPNEFNYASLDGSLKLDANKGQFLKMDPGIGKLLGVLSLQALPKRIALDFTDIFSDGFQFDNINGNVSIKSGVMHTNDFRINGSSAEVVMKGSIDLNHETQDLSVVVLPTLGDSVSLLGFTGGPVGWMGALLVNKVLGNPLDKMASFEYHISGTWKDPNVVKVGEIPVKAKIPRSP